MFQTKVLLIKWTIKNNAIVGKFDFHANMLIFVHRRANTTSQSGTDVLSNGFIKC